MNELNTHSAIEVAESISNFGFMATATAFFLVIAAIMFILFIRWFIRIMDRNMASQQDSMMALIDINKGNAHILHDIRENIGSKTFNQVKILIELSVDSDKLKSLRALGKIAKDNNLKDNEGVIRRKASMIVSNIYNDRFSRMDSFSYDGKKLSSYFKNNWTESLADLFMDELYRRDGFDFSHAHSSIDIFYEDLKLKFIKSLELYEE